MSQTLSNQANPLYNSQTPSPKLPLCKTSIVPVQYLRDEIIPVCELLVMDEINGRYSNMRIVVYRLASWTVIACCVRISRERRHGCIPQRDHPTLIQKLAM